MRKRKFLEETKAELLERIDQLSGEDGDAGNIISELFQAKRDAEEKLEDVKKKLKIETKNVSAFEESNRKYQVNFEEISLY